MTFLGFLIGLALVFAAAFFMSLIVSWIVMLLVGGIFPEFSYWEWVRMCFAASIVTGGAARLGSSN